MDNNGNVMKWSAMRGLAVTLPSEGRTLGIVDNFYFEPGTNSVNALRVEIRLIGYRTLPVIGISTVEQKAVTLPNPQVLLERVPPLPLGHTLLSMKVLNESEGGVGSISEVLLGINPPAAMRIAGLEVSTGAGKRTKTVGADAIAHYGQDAVIVSDYVAKGRR